MSEDKELQIIEKDANGLFSIISSFKVSKKDDLEKAKQYLSVVIKNAEKSIKDYESIYIKPIKEHLKLLNDPILDAKSKLKQCESHLKAEILEYTNKQREKVEIEKEKIAQKVESGEIDFQQGAMQMAKKEQKIEFGVKTREITVLEITDINLIPKEYWVVDESLVRDDLASGKSIPGARLIKKEIIIK